jgi:hypothetical protein
MYDHHVGNLRTIRSTNGAYFLCSGTFVTGTITLDLIYSYIWWPLSLHRLSNEQLWYLKREFNCLLNVIRQQRKIYDEKTVLSGGRGQTYYYKLRVIQHNPWSSHTIFFWICERISWWQLCEQNLMLRQSNSRLGSDRPSITNYWTGVLVHLTSTKNMIETERDIPKERCMAGRNWDQG